jgi:preprotein translocase subunit SecY
MNSELARRIAFTLGALLIYRLGVYVPVPGVDLATWTQIFDSQSSGILGHFNLLSGGAIRSLGLFSLSITPYITSAIFLQMIAMASRRLAALWSDGERALQRFDRYARLGAAILAATQAYGIAVGLEGAGSVVSAPGALFRITTVLTLTGGTLFLVWLGTQITARGIGNGIALILLAGIVIVLPRSFAAVFELFRIGAVSPAGTLGLMVLTVAVTAIVVAMERARRRVPLRFSERHAGGGKPEDQTTHLAYKLNPAGVMPVAIASWLVTIALAAFMLAGFLLGNNPNDGMVRAYGTPLHLVVSTVLILFFVFAYTAFVCDPLDAAERLKTYGGVIAEVAPGEATAEYLDGVLTRTAAMGAVYLTIVILLPEVFALAGLPLPLAGTSVLILVCVTLDIEAQIRAYLAHRG